MRGSVGRDEAEEAFEAHAAMMRTQARERGLIANRFWRASADSAFARFLTRFTQLPGGPDGR